VMDHIVLVFALNLVVAYHEWGVTDEYTSTYNLYN
jgi:hypothetical protein